MIAAIPINTNTIKTTLSEKFARGAWFAIINKNENSCSFIENPYWHEKSEVGNHVIEMLTSTHKVDTIIGFELGLKVQELSSKLNLHVIIINEKNSTLKTLFEKMSINPNII